MKLLPVAMHCLKGTPTTRRDQSWVWEKSAVMQEGIHVYHGALDHYQSRVL
jgi:hypothetical protein